MPTNTTRCPRPSRHQGIVQGSVGSGGLEYDIETTTQRADQGSDIVFAGEHFVGAHGFARLDTMGQRIGGHDAPGPAPSQGCDQEQADGATADHADRGAFDVPRQVDGVERHPEWLEHRSLLVG